MNRRWLHSIFLTRLVAGQVLLQQDSSYILILFMRALKMSTEGDIRVAGQSKFHPMAPLNEIEARSAGPGRKGTLNRRAFCHLESRWLPSVSEAIGV